MSLMVLNGSLIAGGIRDFAASLFGVQDPTLALNGTGVEAYSTNHPFLDHSKQMSAWDSSSGNVDWMITNGHVDAAGGWITSTVLPSNFFKTLNLQADNYYNGKQYRLTWTGAGTLTAPAGATVDSSSANEIVFTLPSDVSNTLVQITATSGPISSMAMVETQYTARYDAGERINPDYSALIADTRIMRFMDWNHTNSSDQESWASRPIESQSSYAKDGNGALITHKSGVPVDLMVELCNRIKSDMWFCFPHAATDEYINEVSTYVLNNLNSELTCTYEMSNEVWNFGFPVQQAYYEALGKTLWPASDGVADDYGILLSAHTYRSWQMAGLINTIYTGVTGRRRYALNVQFEDTLDAPVWDTYDTDPASISELYEAPFNRLTHAAITGYFGIGLLGDAGRVSAIEAAYPGTSDGVITAYLRETGSTGTDISSLEAVNTAWSTWNGYCTARGIKMIQYEGGPHMVFNNASQTSRDAISQWLRSSDAATFATDLTANWAAQTEAEGSHMQFQDIGLWTQFGNWTFQETMDDTPQGYHAQLFIESAARGNWWGDATDYRHSAL